MGKVVLITGGSRSGKSSQALVLAKQAGRKGRVAFIATCEPLDEEMRRRIRRHRQERPRGWKTFETACDPAKALRKECAGFDAVIVDCLTLFVSNLLLRGKGHDEIIAAAEGVAAACRTVKGTVILVTNEVGMGIVPETPLGRDFRDIAGKVNQAMARAADEVFVMFAGMPLKLK